MSRDGDNQEGNSEEEEYIGNIWGWKWSLISLAIILFFISIAVCRYMVVQPDRLIIPEEVETLN